MPTARILLLAAATIADPPPNADAEAPEPRRFEKDKRYDVDVKDARKLIAEGSATLVEVPPQDGLPRGCMDAARLENELRALAPAQPSSAPAQPTPLPDPEPAKEG